MAEQHRRNGQIIRRGDSWLVRVFQGRDSKGKRTYRNETVVGTKTAAQKRLNALISERDSGMVYDAQRQTLDEYLDIWLESVAKPRLRGRTYADYRDLMKRYIRQPLGTVKLANLKALHIQRVYAAMQERGLSPRVIRYTHTVLSSALKKAVELDMIPKNVAKFVQLPKQERKEMKALTREECIRFIEALEGERLAAMFSFALATGMRPEEYLALKWKDIDLEAGYVMIRRALVWHREGGGWEFDEPKTNRSKRKVPLPESVIKEIRHHRIRQHEERLKCGSRWKDFDLIFASSIGTPLNMPNVRRAFKRVTRSANISSNVRLYDLRHTMATLLLQANVNAKIVSERLGHASIVLTLDTYSHVLPDMQEEAAEKLEGILFG